MRFSSKVDGPSLPSPEKIARELSDSVRKGMVSGVRQIQRAILDTPVYTGRTIINYRWSVDTPIEETRAAIKTPLLPGHTSGLRLGSEPRRAANVSLVNEEFAAIVRELTGNPYKRVYLLNNVPNFSEIEYGTYRNGARTPPGGMTRRGEARLRVAMPELKKSE